MVSVSVLLCVRMRTLAASGVTVPVSADSIQKPDSAVSSIVPSFLVCSSAVNQFNFPDASTSIFNGMNSVV